MKRYLACLVAVCGVSACSSPPPPSSGVAAVATPQAEVRPVSSVSPPGSPGEAKTCVVAGFQRTGAQLNIYPTITMSNDGYCGHIISTYNAAAQEITIEQAPGHGQITTLGQGTTAAVFRYSPNQGYVGPDSFALSIGIIKHPHIAHVSVTVTS